MSLRVEAASANALHLARWLEEQDSVESVCYPGLESSPDHTLARRQFEGGYGGMLSFTLRGGLAAAARVVRGLELVHFMPSLADVATTVSHPVSTSHRAMEPATLSSLGIGPGMLRVSAGIEDIDDLKEDLIQALDNV